MPPSPLEQIEKLEQLRVLEAGYSILVGVVDEPTFGIDTPDDYRAFVEKQRWPARLAGVLAAAFGLTSTAKEIQCNYIAGSWGWQNERHVVKSHLVRIGNSRGVRIPQGLGGAARLWAMK